jgi:hypothetical protein
MFDRLVMRFGAKSVFMDIGSIPYGADFRKKIDQAWRQCKVVIVVVGPQWLGQRAAGDARIGDKTDGVRVEVEMALARKLHVIPVLVGKATMPAANLLPKSLERFSYLNALNLDFGADFDFHIARLIAAIGETLGAAPATLPALAATLLQTVIAEPISWDATMEPARRPLTWRLWSAYVAILAAALLLAHYLVVTEFDLSTVYLGFAFAVVPLIAGFLLARHPGGGIRAAFLMGALAGIVAVSLMNVVVGIADSTSIIPTDLPGWQESLEYLVEVTLAAIAGNALATAHRLV